MRTPLFSCDDSLRAEQALPALRGLFNDFLSGPPRPTERFLGNANDSIQAPASKLAVCRAWAQKGFTLIEIMVVIAILGILAALIVPKIMSRPDQARRVAASQDIGTIMQAMKLYRLDNGRYPTQEQGLNALIQKPAEDPVPNNWKDGGYLERLPKDPWGASYQYLNPGVHGDIDVFSFGADSKAGGEGNDADIGSWQ